MLNSIRAVMVSMLLLSGVACAGKKSSRPDTPAPIAAPGMPFSLPKTLVRIQLTLNKTTKKNGKFCQDKELFFPEAPTCSTDAKGTSETSLKGYSVNTRGVPDQNRSYFIPVSKAGGWAIDTSSGMELDDHGLLNSVSEERTNRRVEVVVGAIKGVAGIITKAFTAGAATPPQPAKPPTTAAEKDAQDEQNFETIFLGTEDWQLIWNFESLGKEKRTGYVKRWKDHDPALFAARRAYAELQQLGDDLHNVENGRSGAASAPQLILELQKQIENRQSSYFTGTKETASWTPTFEFEPTEKQDVVVPLISIAPCGAAVVADPTAKFKAILVDGPRPKDFDCPDADKGKRLSLKLAAPSQAPPSGDIKACVDSTNLIKGIPFALPAETDVQIVETELLAQKLQIAQWGTASCLTLPGSTYTAAVTYFASTGSIKTLKFTQKSAVSKDVVDVLTGTASDTEKSILDARQKANDEAKNKELNDVTYKEKVLSEKVKIKDACDKLHIDCEF